MYISGLLALLRLNRTAVSSTIVYRLINNGSFFLYLDKRADYVKIMN